MNESTAGLCLHCHYKRVVESQRGSVFLMCERSQSDGKFAKYPHLPVLQCEGYEEEIEEGQ